MVARGITVFLLLILSSIGTEAFQLLPRAVITKAMRPSTSLHMAAAVKLSSAVVAPPSNLFQKVMSASLKNKAIVGLHALAVMAVLWLLKWTFLTFFKKQATTASEVEPKKRVTVASVAPPTPTPTTTTVSSYTSIEQAKTQVVSILETLDQAKLQAKQRVEQSITTIMGRDPG